MTTEVPIALSTADLGFNFGVNIPLLLLLPIKDRKVPETAACINYYQVPIDSLTEDQKLKVSEWIVNGVEKLFDEEYKKGVGWTVEEFNRTILHSEGSVVVVAVRGKTATEGPLIVGYASAIPALAEKFTQEELTTTDKPNRLLRMPDANTLEFDTIGVVKEFRGTGVGKDLFIHRKRIAFANPRWKSFSVVLLEGAASRKFIEKDPDLNISILRESGKVSEGPINFRGFPAYYIFCELSTPIKGY